MQPSGTPAVVLSGNLGTPVGKWSISEPALAVTRSLGRRNVPVFRFHPDRSLVDLISRYCTHVPCPNLYEDPDGLVDALTTFARRLNAGAPVLFPASDGAARFIARHEAALGEHYRLTSPTEEHIEKVQNKRYLIEIASSIDVPVPETYFPSEPGELLPIAESVSYPVVIKPLFSTDWKRPEVTKAFGRVKAMQVTEPQDLLDKCRALLALSSTFMVQEIVQGPDDLLLTFLGYIDRDGKPLAGCVRSKLRQFPPDFGYCSLTESVHDDEIFELSVRLLNALEYRGIGCVEFKRDPGTGAPKLIEINTRAVRTSALAIASGVDFPWIAYRDQTEPGSVSPSVVAEVPVRWVHVRDELAAAALLMCRGKLSPIRWIRGFWGKRLVAAEFSWDDVGPALLFWAQVPGRLLNPLFRPRSPAALPSRSAPGNVAPSLLR
jgi:predicted ATP-grasp superfamily ATP-dependent carboligase